MDNRSVGDIRQLKRNKELVLFRLRLKTILSNDCTKSHDTKQLLVAKPRATRKSALHNQSQILPKHESLFFALDVCKNQ